MDAVKSSRNLKLLLIPVVLSVFSMGCARGMKKHENELVLRDNRIVELEGANANLLNQVDRIKHREKNEANRIKTLAGSSLVGTGIVVNVRDNDVVSLTLPSSSYFSVGNVKLKQEAKSNLKRISLLLKKQFFNKTVRIEGHTDNEPVVRTKGKYKTNWELSAARAISVLYYLTNECGLSPDNIYIAGFGEFRPIADNKTKSGRNQNRRVEIVIIP